MAASTTASSSLYDISVRSIKLEEKTFGDYAKGKVALVVNVASQCGFTKQYTGLEVGGWGGRWGRRGHF